MRQQEAERRANHAAEVSLAFAQATAQPQQQQWAADNSASAAEYEPAAPPQITEELLRTLKVTWDKQNSSSYSVDQLKRIMRIHGPVEDIVLTQSKKKRKGSALVVMQTLDSARAASEAVNGSLENPLLVLPLAKAAAPSAAGANGLRKQPCASPDSYAPMQPQAQPQPAFPISQSTTPPTPPSSPMKAQPVRNPFGGSYSVTQPGPDSVNNQYARPAFPPTSDSGPPKPLFAAGAGRAAGFFPPGLSGYSSSSYSSFPGAVNGVRVESQPGFGHNNLAHTVQAGVKR